MNKVNLGVNQVSFEWGLGLPDSKAFAPQKRGPGFENCKKVWRRSLFS